MQRIDIDTAQDFLRKKRWIGSDEEVFVHAMAGGVSGSVLYVRRPSRAGRDFVLKQAREQVLAAEPWCSSVERNWREVEVLQLCNRLLAQERRVAAEETGKTVQTPEVLCVDRRNFIFAMRAAPPHHAVWRQQLLAGRADAEIAQACGRLLGRLHGLTWSDQRVAAQLAHAGCFEDFRVNADFRHVAKAHEDLAPAMLQLIQSLQDNRVALVHGDFDPDNLLVWDDDLMLVDYEVGHYGDPAFDLGFFFSRLVAQAFCAADRKARLPLLDAFWAAYSRALDVRVAEEQGRRLFARAMWSLGASALAAVDGKSRVDYLVDNELRDRVRAFGRAVLLQPPNNWDDCRRTVLSHLETC